MLVASKIAGYEQEIERENYIEAAASYYKIGFESLRKLVISELIKGAPGSEAVKKQTAAEKSSDRAAKEKKAQRLLLCWMADYPKFINTIKEYLTPDDFKGEPDRTIAQYLMGQEGNAKIDLPALSDKMEDAEERRVTAMIFQTGLSDLPEEELKRAMKEALKKVLEQSITGADQSKSSLDDTLRVIERKRQLQKIDRLQIEL